MKLWLDDLRPAPPGWIWVKSAQECVSLLSNNEVEELSLDHDLGDEPWTGYWVLCWLEERVHAEGFVLPRDIRVHTANPVGRARMLAALAAIQRANPADP